MSAAYRFGYARAMRKWIIIMPLAVLLTLVVAWQIAHAQAPVPNPLAPLEKGGNPIFAPVAGVDITKNGPAAQIHGDPARGRTLFATNCTTCHGDRGTEGIVNPGSDDGSVPILNPIDPGFVEDSQGDPQAFVNAIDLFIQHGSRPAGDDPQTSMIGWGDQKLRTQSEIADLEAYVMQLNGIYWPDRYYPPAEVRMTAARSGSNITYTITLVNHGATRLTDLTLRDTLSEGLAYVKSGVPNLDGDNPASVDGSTVSWVNGDGVPVGGTLGPFIIVARIQGKTVPPNVAELLFSYLNLEGDTLSASAVSDPIVPAEPKAAVSATPVPTATAPLPAASAGTTTTTGTVVPTPTIAPAPTIAPTPTAPPSSINAKIVQPDPGALSWTFDPQTITLRVGDKVTWTNAGSLAHTVTADNGSFDSGILNTNDSFTFTFNNAGTFTFHCTPHPWMKGTVNVQK